MYTNPSTLGRSVLNLLMGGRFTSPQPPSAGPPRRPCRPKPPGAALKRRSPTTFPAEACKNLVPQARSPLWSLCDPFGESVAGLLALAAVLRSFEAGLQTLKTRLCGFGPESSKPSPQTSDPSPQTSEPSPASVEVEPSTQTSKPSSQTSEPSPESVEPSPARS